MSGFTKLKSSIITSTIWRESPAICKVWITMLALSDSYGVVEGSIPGLADMARVSIPEVEAALEKFRSPDPYSRSKEHEGRRIQDQDGGWLVLNYGKHRGYLTGEDKRAADRIRQQIHRQKKLSRDSENKPVTPDSVSASVSESDCISSSFKESERENEDYVAEIRRLDWRDKESVTVEQEFAMQVSKGHAPAAIVAKLEQIHVWTNEGAYAPRLYEVIKRWQEPRHLWERKNDDERRAIPERTRVNATALEGFRANEARRNSERTDSNGRNDRRKDVNGGPDSVR